LSLFNLLFEQEIAMGFFQEFAEGFATTLNAIAANHAVLSAASPRIVSQERGRIERLCSDLGWGIDERDAQSIRLHFNDPSIGIRKVGIYAGDAEVVIFLVSSMACMQSAPPQMMEYLLERPMQIQFGSWVV